MPHIDGTFTAKAHSQACGLPACDGSEGVPGTGAQGWGDCHLLGPTTEPLGPCKKHELCQGAQNNHTLWESVLLKEYLKPMKMWFVREGRCEQVC